MIRFHHTTGSHLAMPLFLMFQAATVAQAEPPPVPSNSSHTPADAPTPVLVMPPIIVSPLMRNLVRLDGRITKETAAAIETQLKSLSEHDPKKKITLYINSEGGDVAAGERIMQALREIPNKVDVVCAGEAQSMAAVIFLTHPKKKGDRIVFEKCHLITHAAYYRMETGARTLDNTDLSPDERKDLTKTRLDFAKALAARTRLPLSEAKKFFTTKDYVLSVRRARKIGFIDRLVKPD